MRYGSLKEKLTGFAADRPDLVTTLDKVFESPGMATSDAEHYGFSKKDLKRLEKLGLAVRARTKNVWIAGETLPSGNVVNPGESFRGKGSRLMWILVP